MPWVRRSPPGPGHWIMVLSASAAFAVAVASYRAQGTSIDQTPAAAVMWGWSAALLLAGLALPAVRGVHPGVHGALVVLSLLGIAGVAVAALLLMNAFVLACMAFGLSGLLTHVLFPRAAHHYRRPGRGG